jgi:hypothetical protein
MVFVPSIREVAQVVKFAWDLCSSCHAAPTEFRRAEGKVLALSINLSESESVANDPKSIVRTNQGKQKSFETLLGLCQGALEDVQTIRNKYSGHSMSVTDRLKWVAGDEKAFDKAMAHLEFVTTQFDKFLDRIGSGVIGASKVEEALDDEDDATVAVNNAIKGQPGISKTHQQNLLKYAKLSVSSSGGEYQGWKASGHRRPGCYMECWTVTKASVLGYTDFKKEKEKRGQWKLSGMASDFKITGMKIASEKDDDRVGYILKYKRSEETDSRYEWSYVAARIERQESAAGGIANVEEVMVIIERQMTQAAQNALPHPHPPPNKNCRNGGGCRNSYCKYSHPHVPPCQHGTACTNSSCEYAHLLRHTTFCRAKASCRIPKCRYKHPVGTPCWHGAACTNSSCEFAHLPQHTAICRDKASCRNPKCKYRHPLMTPCWHGIDCKNVSCEYAHLPQNATLCRDLGHCKNTNCKYNHSAAQ